MHINPKEITKNRETDFIVNMTKPQFMKVEFFYLLITIVATLGCCVPYYLMRTNEFLSGTESDFVKSVMKNSDVIEYLKYGVIVLMAVGFFGILMLFISATKEYFKIKNNMSVLLLLGYLLLCLVASLKANDVRLAFFGNGGRYEGFIAIVSYAGIFLGASQLTDKKLKEKLLVVLAVGISIHAIVGIFQSFESTGKLLPSFFTENYTFNGMEIKNFVANGFATSPYALSSLCVMGLAVCLGGFMYTESRGLRICFLICEIAVAFGGFLTKNVAILVGAVVVFATLLIIEIARIMSGHCLVVNGIFKNPVGKLILGGLIGGIIFVILKVTGNFTFEDSYIIMQDSYNRLFLSWPEYNVDGVKIYPHLWKESLESIKANPVFGGGFEGFINPDLSVVGTCDRPYNEFLYIAQATGIASLVFYVGFLVGCAIRGVKGLKRFFNKEDNYTKAVAFSGCAGYIACAMFSTSTIVSTPIFFVLLGLAFSREEI